ncbi:MAG: hypothetical protein APF76_09330 [Desulfitibacter sp. BRH_c19]|nr:MAG: hypothetical protein APF76_09330 [Desulfitibacter sp. BRH_c19]
MSFSFKLKSHVQEGIPFEDGQLLVDHLQGVKNIAIETSKMHGVVGEIEKIIGTICMCHDFGKASEYFQKYLKNEYSEKLKNHGEISAYFVFYMLPQPWKILGFMAVKKHHGNLEPDRIFFDYNEKQLWSIAESIKKNVEELNEIYKQDISGFFEEIKNEQFLKAPWKSFRKKMKSFSIEDFIWMQYIWSLLLTGDKTQLIRGTAYLNSMNVYESYVSKYKDQIKKELMQRISGIEKTKLFHVRNQIYRDAVKGIEDADLTKNHIFSINVPTGTGKTLAVYATAFKLLERIYNESQKTIKPTIVYNIPFTSVIDQNYKELENILHCNNVERFESYILKHHSMTELNYTDYSETLDEEKEYRNYDARFCVENWQSTIITTTFVQLFNTIFQSGINAIINRFHKLAGSIIILDEVQAIPPKYYNIIQEVFEVLCNKFNCYVITVTATKPLFLEGEELIKNNEGIFKSLDRIQIENHIDNPIYLNDFCEILVKDIQTKPNKSFLIVLNTVKSSLNVLDYLRGSEELQIAKRSVLYLSTEIHPHRRLEVIQKIKKDKDIKYILVSTQLIEAGVDVDFDMVYRDFSTIDSINQTAGRANRNAINEKGIVKIFSLINENHHDKKYATYIYSQPLLDATEEILSKKGIICEKDFFEINNAYFKAVQEKKSKDSSQEIEEAISEFNFARIRQLFKLIEENYQKEDVIINYNEEAQKCLGIIQEGNWPYQDTINAWRVLNKYKVSVNKEDMKNINTILIKGIHVLDKKYYDKNKGIIRINTVIC